MTIPAGGQHQLHQFGNNSSSVNGGGGTSTCDGEDDDLMLQLLSQFEQQQQQALQSQPVAHCKPCQTSQAQYSHVSHQHSPLVPSYSQPTGFVAAAQSNLGLIYASQSTASSPRQFSRPNPGAEAAEFERLKRENLRIQQEKRALMMEKLCKEGEVTIVRNKLVQKEEENHALQNQLNQLSAQQHQITRGLQQKFQQEIESMKTQLLFQSQELLSAKQRTLTVRQVVPVEKKQIQVPFRDGNGFDIADNLSKKQDYLKQSNEGNGSKREKDVPLLESSFFDDLIDILQYLDDSKLKLQLARVRHEGHLSTENIGVLESIIRHGVNTENTDLIFVAVQFAMRYMFQEGIIQGDSGVLADSRKQDFKLLLVSITQDCISRKLIDICSSALYPILSVKSADKDFVGVIITKELFVALINDGDLNLLGIKTLSELADWKQTLELSGEQLALVGNSLWPLDRSSDEIVDWVLYFYIRAVFAHYTTIEFLQKLFYNVLPKVTMLLFELFHSVYLDFLERTQKRTKTMKYCLRLIYLLNTSYSLHSTRNQTMDWTNNLELLTIEVEPEVCLKIGPVLSGILKLLPECSEITLNLLDEEIAMAERILHSV